MEEHEEWITYLRRHAVSRVVFSRIAGVLFMIAKGLLPLSVPNPS